MSINHYTTSVNREFQFLKKLNSNNLFRFRLPISIPFIFIFIGIGYANAIAQLNGNPLPMPCYMTLTPQIHVTPEQNAIVCIGTEVTYTANVTNGGTAPFVQWYISNLPPQPQDTGLTIKVKVYQTGPICAKVYARDLNTVSMYCFTKDGVVGNCPFVTVETVPKPVVTLKVDCVNKLVTATVVSPATGVRYSFDGGAFNNDSSKIFSADGHHTVVLKETGGLLCLSDPTDFDVVLPKSFTASANVSVPTCADPTAKITVSTTPPNSATLFSFDNGVTYGSSNMMVKPEGNYNIIAESGLSCFSNVITVNVGHFKFMGNSANITVMGTMLMASPGVSYQWYFNGQIIPGATQQMFQTYTYGDYSVTIVNELGCVSTASTHVETDYVDNCPQIHKNFGAKCDDGDPNTINDRVRNTCKCRGDLYSPNMTVKCPDNIVVLANDPYGTIVNWDLKFTTNCTSGRENWVDVVQTSGYYSGYPFENNSFTQIEYVGTDLCGNKTSCSFFVTVSPYYGKTPVSSGLQTKTVSAYIPIVVESIFPNPAEDDLHLKILSREQKEIRFDFFNSLGSSLKSEKRILEKGQNDIIFDVSGFQGGVYYVIPQITLGHDVPTKFVKF